MPIPIIDAHTHLWDLNRIRLPWLETYPSLNRSFVLSDYREATQGIEIAQCIYMEVDAPNELLNQEAEYAIALCENPDSIVTAAVLGCRPASAGFADYIEEYGSHPNVVGFRQVLHVPESLPGACLQPEFLAGMEILQNWPLTFDLCMRPSELADAAELADRFPMTTFILDHCGNAPITGGDMEGWRIGMTELAKRHNVYAKVSGIVVFAESGGWTAKDLEPTILHTVESFGIDRVLYGGDWPVCTLKASYYQWTSALFEIIDQWPAEDKRLLLHDNAIMAYGLG